MFAIGRSSGQTEDASVGFYTDRFGFFFNEIENDKNKRENDKHQTFSRKIQPMLKL